MPCRVTCHTHQSNVGRVRDAHPTGLKRFRQWVFSHYSVLSVRTVRTVLSGTIFWLEQGVAGLDALPLGQHE